MFSWTQVDNITYINISIKIQFMGNIPTSNLLTSFQLTLKCIIFSCRLCPPSELQTLDHNFSEHGFCFRLQAKRRKRRESLASGWALCVSWSQTWSRAELQTRVPLLFFLFMWRWKQNPSSET